MKAYQFFPKNPRSLTIKQVDRRDAEACRQFITEHEMKAIIHTPYPVNLAAEDEAVRKATIESILNDLDICDACGALGLVVHFGKYKGEHLLHGYQTIIRTLDEVLSRWHGTALILLENQAGEARRMGTTFEELTQVRSLSAYRHKIGFCFDTCHAFASGLWNGRNSQELLERGLELHYWQHVQAVHLNDSLYGSGMMKDRHAPLGEGKIGLDSLADLLSASFFRDIPHILETPEKKDHKHSQQISRYLRLIDKRRGQKYP